MTRKQWLAASFTVIASIALFVGCQHKRGCVGGSCAAPSYGSSTYATGSAPAAANYGSVNSYSDNASTYSPPVSGGSGTRSAPIMQGSGTR